MNMMSWPNAHPLRRGSLLATPWPPGNPGDKKKRKIHGEHFKELCAQPSYKRKLLDQEASLDIRAYYCASDVGYTELCIADGCHCGPNWYTDSMDFCA